jgi:tRNA-modifying protein YgfZ
MEQLDGTAPYGASLARYGMLAVRGSDARAFLHAQLTNDIQNLGHDRAALAGWCSAKGRLLASLLVIPAQEGFLLQLARDLASAVAKRLSMFVLRSKVRVGDESDSWVQVGLWGETAADALRDAGLPVPEGSFVVAGNGTCMVVRYDSQRFLMVAPAPELPELQRRVRFSPAGEDAWIAQEIQAGRALISTATQDQFVPQMVNLERLGGVDFHKGCYPGQEIVARTQYRGQVKRRLVKATVPAGVKASPGQDVYADELPGQASGTVVDAADGALLAVLPLELSSRSSFRLGPGGPALQIHPEE